MESRAITPIFPELPEQSPDRLIPKKNPILERMAMLSPTLTHFAQLKKHFNPFQKVEDLDEKLLEKRADDLPVAYHEMGHVAVAEDYGAETSATVIPGDGYRGLTRSVLRATMSLKNQIHARIRIALGGHAGEERGGQTDHSGTGSDMGQVQYWAEVLSVHFYEGAYSAAQIIADEFSNARRIVFSCMNFDQRSLHLTEQQSI